MSAPPAPAAPAPTTMRRVAVASCVGTTIEFYDFFIYGTAAALVFPQIFFPALGPVAGTAASFATFAVAFVVRPLGAIVFGHYGDKLGRKGTLVTTLLLMGVATVAIGLLPTGAVIGAAAPILLILLRVAQGLAVGGEWAGANLLTAEYAPPGKRGTYAVFPQLGPALAFALSSSTFLATDVIFGSDAFLTYGWRIPFLLSALLVGVGLYIRLSIDETPVFKADRDKRAAAKAPTTPPVLEVFRVQPREIVLGAFVQGIGFGFFYMGTAYLTAYGSDPAGAGLDRRVVLSLGILAAVALAVTTIVGGRISDRLGRRPIILASGAMALLWSLALFPVLDIGTAFSFGVGITVTLAIFGIMYGPVGAYLPELFATRFRYTGAGMAYNLAGVLGGAVPPVLAPILTARFGSIGIGVLLAVLAGLSIVATLILFETANRDTMHDAEEPLAA
jgi:MFS family permease